jgi:hypothetical protein
LPAYGSGVNITQGAPKELVKVRTAVLEYLPQLGSGWQSFEDLVEDMRSEAYGFLFQERKITGYRTYNWRTGQYDVETPYLGRNNSYGVSFRDIKTEKEGWDKVEVALINHIIAGPLYWLGLVELGYDEAQPDDDFHTRKRISYYRLTEYGEWLINKKARPKVSAESEATVLVQPNFELMVMGRAADSLLMNLDLFCQVVNEQEYTTTFRISRQSVYAAQKLGWSVSRILAYLEEITHKPVPQNVRRSLEEWGALQERVTIRQKVQLVHTADTAVADEIAANPAFATWRRIAPTAFLTDDVPDKLSQALEQAHWIPLRTPARETSAPNSIVISDEGEVRFIQPTPSIYAAGLLQNLTAESDHGRVLTPALIKSAIQDSSLQEVINQLQKLHRGPLSQRLIIRLKSWVNYYGPAQLATLILVEFSSLQIRDELLADPELSPYLTKFEAGNRPLAIVAPEGHTAVETILRERNITLTNQLAK